VKADLDMCLKEIYGEIVMSDDVEFIGTNVHGAIYVLGTDRFFKIDSSPDSHDIMFDGEVVVSYRRLFNAEEAYRQATMQKTLGDVMAVFAAA